MKRYNELKKHVGHSLTVQEAEAPDTGIVLHCRDCEDDLEHIEKPSGALDCTNASRCCEECGGAVMPDPDGSPGVWVHASPEGESDHDADADHVALPEVAP